MFFRRRSQKALTLSLFELPSDGFCAVAGESFYQSALITTRGDFADSFEGRPSFVAALVPEPDNPYDGNAIAVYSSCGKLGYLPRERAAQYRRLFQHLTRRGYDGARCHAHLTGGDAGKSHGVVLRLAGVRTCLQELKGG